MRNLHESVNFSNEPFNELCSFDSNNTSINKQRDDRPYIEVHVANTHISCLIDSGASRSVCNDFGTKFFLSLGYKLLKTSDGK